MVLQYAFRRAYGFQNLVGTSVYGGHDMPPLVGIGLRWLPKLGVDTSPRPHAHRRALSTYLPKNNLVSYVNASLYFIYFKWKMGLIIFGLKFENLAIVVIRKCFYLFFSDIKETHQTIWLALQWGGQTKRTSLCHRSPWSSKL